MRHGYRQPENPDLGTLVETLVHRYSKPSPDDGTNWITVSQCMIQSFQKHGIDILPFAVSASLSTAGEKVSTGRTILD